MGLVKQQLNPIPPEGVSAYFPENMFTSSAFLQQEAGKTRTNFHPTEHHHLEESCNVFAQANGVANAISNPRSSQLQPAGMLTARNFQ